MSKIVMIDYIKNNKEVLLDEKTSLIFTEDTNEIEMKYKDLIIARINYDNLENKYISVKMNRIKSEMMLIRHPFNPVIEKIWQYRFFQKHRVKSIDEYYNLIDNMKGYDNLSRMSYYEILNDCYNICVKIDTKFDIMIPVAFYVDFTKGTSISRLDEDLKVLFNKYSPIGKEILY